jgi:membrane protease YdiL (CAAX protease family)
MAGGKRSAKRKASGKYCLKKIVFYCSINGTLMHIKQGWLRVIVFLVVWIFILSLVHLIGFELLERSWDKPIESLSLDEHIASIALSLIGTLLTLVFFKKIVDREPFSEAGITTHRVGKQFLLGAILGTAIISLGFFILLSAGEIVPRRSEVAATDMIKGLILYLMVAVNEEFLMRGYVQVNLSRSFNRYFAIVLASSLFAALHIFNMGITNISLVNLTLSGILLGVNFLFIKNIWYSVGLHFMWNYVQGFIFGFHVSGLDNPSFFEVKYYQPDIWNGGVFGFEGSVVCTILSVISIGGMFVYFKKNTLLPETAAVAPLDELLVK